MTEPTDRRAAVLVAARSLLADVAQSPTSASTNPLPSFTLSEVARRAGVTRTTLYRYFRNRDELLAAIGSDSPAADGEERRRSILDAALRCAARWGFRGATMERIGQEAGISPAAIYWYFPSKDDLINSLLDAYTPLPDLRQLRQLPIGGEEEQLRRLIRRVLAVLDERLDVVKTVLSEGYDRPEIVREFYQEVSSKFVAEIAAYIERRVAAGVFRSGPTFARALAFISPLVAYSFARRNLGEALPLSREAAVEEFVAIFLGGLRVPLPASARPTQTAASIPSVTEAEK